MGKKVTKPELEEADELRELVNGDVQVEEGPKQSRRGLLKMAGAALAGAAGAAALRAVPASAATGNAVLIGCYNFPSSVNQPTYIDEVPLGASTPNSEAGTAFIGRSATGLAGHGYYGTDHTQEIGVFGLSKNSAGTGVAGQADTGIGIAGKSSSGTGVFGVSNTGYDVQLGFPVVGGTVGSGRLAMVGRTDVGGIGPSWGPAFQVTSTGIFTFQHELVRGNDGSIWASRFDASTSPNSARWKRINAVRVDSADGAGSVFKPFRVIDTRVTSSPPVVSGRPQHGTLAVPKFHVVTVAGTGTGTSHIPADAIAVMGNLTAVKYAGPGFLAIMPAGIAAGTGAGQYNPNADPSSVNFVTAAPAIANAFVCGLNGGQLQVFVGISDSHFIVDITAYLQ